jgi:hypothetical protein
MVRVQCSEYSIVSIGHVPAYVMVRVYDGGV